MPGRDAGEFPYAGLAAENARRGHDVPEYELADTGIFAGDRDLPGVTRQRPQDLLGQAEPELCR
jgi:hypothetical protein